MDDTNNVQGYYEYDDDGFELDAPTKILKTAADELLEILPGAKPKKKNKKQPKASILANTSTVRKRKAAARKSTVHHSIKHQRKNSRRSNMNGGDDEDESNREQGGDQTTPTKKGRKSAPTSSRGSIIQYDANTNEQVGLYDSARDAARDMWKTKGMEGSFDWMRQKIGGVLRKDKPSFNGFIYRYTTDNDHPSADGQAITDVDSTKIDNHSSILSLLPNEASTTASETTPKGKSKNKSKKLSQSQAAAAARGGVIKYDATTGKELQRFEKPADAGFELWQSKNMEGSLDWIRQKISMTLRREKKQCDGFIYRYENDPLDNSGDVAKQEEDSEDDEKEGTITNPKPDVTTRNNDDMDANNEATDNSAVKQRAQPLATKDSIIQYSASDPSKELARFDSIAKAGLDIWKSKDLKGSLDAFKRGVGQVLKGEKEAFEGYSYRYAIESTAASKKGGKIDQQQQQLSGTEADIDDYENAAATKTTPNSKKDPGNSCIIQYAITDPDEEIARFESITKAAQEVWKSKGMTGSWDSIKRAVGQVLSKRRQSYEGYIYRYEKDQESARIEEQASSKEVSEATKSKLEKEQQDSADDLNSKSSASTTPRKPNTPPPGTKRRYQWTGGKGSIVQFNAETDEELARYDSIIDAAREQWKAKGMKGSIGSIRNYVGEVLRRKRDSYNGFYYRHAAELTTSSSSQTAKTNEDQSSAPPEEGVSKRNPLNEGIHTANEQQGFNEESSSSSPQEESSMKQLAGKRKSQPPGTDDDDGDDEDSVVASFMLLSKQAPANPPSATADDDNDHDDNDDDEIPAPPPSKKSKTTRKLGRG